MIYLAINHERMLDEYRYHEWHAYTIIALITNLFMVYPDYPTIDWTTLLWTTIYQ